MPLTRSHDIPQLTSARELEGFGRPNAIVRDKVEERLHDVHRDWIAATPFLLVATADRDGRCDVSPKGDPAGFVHVLDDRMLAIPERAGNHRFDGFHNILDNPHVGLIFLVPGRTETLRVNGTATLVSDGPFFDTMTVRAHRPVLAVVVGVEEVFFHCPRALLRGAVWEPDRWRPAAVRPYAEIAKALWRQDDPIEEIEARQAPKILDAQLYPASSRSSPDREHQSWTQTSHAASTTNS